MIRCTVVEVFEPGQTMEQDHFSSRDLLPWADPYIAQLLAMHQVQLADEPYSEPWSSQAGTPAPWDESWDIPVAEQGRLGHFLSDEASPPLGRTELPKNRFRLGGR